MEELFDETAAASTAAYSYSNSSSIVNVTVLLPPRRFTTVVASCIMIMSLVVGLCGTTWIIAALIASKDLVQNVVNICILSLSINDLLNLFMNQLLVTGSYVAHLWPFGDFLCHFMPECNMFLVSSSLWHHALIAIHRYIVVCHDSWYRGTSKTLYVVVIVVTTRLIPIAIGLPAIFESMSEYDPTLLRCITKSAKRIRTLIVFLTTIILPCCIVLSSFVLIVVFMCRTKRKSMVRRPRLQPQPSLIGAIIAANASKVSLRREIQITKMFGAIFGVMVAGFIPYGLVRSLDTSKRFRGDIYVAVSVLYAIASAANPVVYGAMNRQIRALCVTLCTQSKRLTRTERSLKRATECVYNVVTVGPHAAGNYVNKSMDVNQALSQSHQQSSAVLDKDTHQVVAKLGSGDRAAPL